MSPLVCLAGININRNGTTLCFLNESAPIISFRLRLPLKNYFLFSNGIAGNHLVGLLIKLEGQWRHIDGNGDIRIVGVYVREAVSLSKHLR